jgi:hypothetical protein
MAATDLQRFFDIKQTHPDLAIDIPFEPDQESRGNQGVAMYTDKPPGEFLF